jgi:hypothetical protein
MRYLFTLLLIAAATPCLSEEHPGGKKLIEWGWDEPDTKFIRTNIERMEEYPFDGFIFHVVSSKGGNFTWEMWGSRRFDIDEFRHSIDNLKATEFHRFTDRFLRVNVTPGKTDWFDDEAWRTVLNNFAVAAQVAEEGGCKGFMFDVEQYNEGLFNYGKQKHRDSKTFANYQARVRQRGREWIKEVNRHFPDITILLTFGYRVAQPPEGKSRSEAHYGLLADFLDGLLEACSEQTRIVDAWEYSYPYKERRQFEEAYATIKEKSADWTAVPDKYRRHVEAGFGIWMDCRWRQVGWNLDDFSKNHFTPDQFETAVRSALDLSDEYVWVYTEQPRWWTSERLPSEYVSALNGARTTGKRAPGFHAVQCEGTYPHHLQGVCTNEKDAIYWSFTTALIKTGTNGKVLTKVPVANHHGDLCHVDGKVYVAVNLGKFNDPEGNADSWVYVYDADDLSLLQKHETQEVFHGAGGIAARGRHFFVVGGLPDAVDENYVYQYDDEFRFVKKHVVESGHTHLGIQTAAFANGQWWFGCYGDPKILLVTDADFGMKGRYEFDCSLGIVGLPDGRFLSASGRCEKGEGCTGWTRLAEADDRHGLKAIDKP